jgi:chorismate synthase
VEIGAGFGVARMFGSQCNDPLGSEGFEKNDAGGILGGISNGGEIVLRVAVKPIPSISLEQSTVDQTMRPVSLRIKGRHDVSAIPRINSVCEAMVAIVLADHLLRQRTLTGYSTLALCKKSV